MTGQVRRGAARFQCPGAPCPLLLALGLLLAPLAGKSQPAGRLEGRVHDIVSGEPLGFAYLQLEQIDQAVYAHPDGSFHFLRVPPGRWTLRVSRIGYQPLLRELRIEAGDTRSLKLFLERGSLALEQVELVARRDSMDALLGHPDVELEGSSLQRELGTTIAQTMREEPGVAERSMGPAPGRPVLRGLSGDRLLVLEDGQRTGDLSASSSDHAVAIEPMTAERIVVLRGPETLLHGPGTLGGVVNVERDAIVMTPLHRVQGSATLLGQSAHPGGAFGANLSLPLGAQMLRVDGSLRGAGDLQTPEGQLKNTGLLTTNGSLGLSRVGDLGVVGVSLAHYRSRYGIPGGFVGAHADGIDVRLNRLHGEAALRWNRPGRTIRRVEMDYGVSRYYHAEYEAGGRLGMEFGVLSDQLQLRAQLGEQLLFDRGVLGLEGRLRNYATGGLSFTPATNEAQLGLFLYESARWARWQLTAALRLDLGRIHPRPEGFSRLLGAVVRQRDFAGPSASLRLEREIGQLATLGAVAMRTFRMPTVQELFSEGPHLAAYSYEIGSPDLGAERGTGGELFARVRRGRLTGRASLFATHFDSFIFPRNTGRFSPRRADLLEYRYAGLDAATWGAEASLALQLSAGLRLSGSATHVRGELLSSNRPMPMMPPFGGRAELEWSVGRWSLSSALVGAAAQRRTDEFEEPSSAWLRLDLGVVHRLPSAGALHVVTFEAENLLNSSYRRHLSRVKSLLPEAGRNLRATLRVYY